MIDVEVYFGWLIPHEVPEGGFVEALELTHNLTMHRPAQGQRLWNSREFQVCRLSPVKMVAVM